MSPSHLGLPLECRAVPRDRRRATPRSSRRPRLTVSAAGSGSALQARDSARRPIAAAPTAVAGAPRCARISNGSGWSRSRSSATAAQVWVEVAAQHVAQERAQVALDLVHERLRGVRPDGVEVGVARAVAHHEPLERLRQLQPPLHLPSLGVLRAQDRHAQGEARSDRRRSAPAAPAGSPRAPPPRAARPHPISNRAQRPRHRCRRAAKPSIARRNSISSTSSPSTRTQGSLRATPVGSSSNGCQRPSPALLQASVPSAIPPRFHSRSPVSRRGNRSRTSSDRQRVVGRHVARRASASAFDLAAIGIAPERLVGSVGRLAAHEAHPVARGRSRSDPSRISPGTGTRTAAACVSS